MAKHIHKYHKVSSKYHIIWKCAISDCSHFMPPYWESTLAGRATVCWNCGKQTVLDEINMQMDNPTCIDCRFAEIAITDDAFERALAEPVKPQSTLQELSSRSLNQVLADVDKTLDEVRK